MRKNKFSTFKEAFKLNAGLYLGGYLAYDLVEGIKVMLARYIVGAANNGSKRAQDYCREMNLKFEESSNDNDAVTNKIGFRVNN